MRSRTLRVIAATGCVALPLLLAGPASAHAAYESSDPANGSTVSSPPSRVIAEFTEPVVQGSTLAVFDPCGQQVDNGDSLVATDRITVTMSGEYTGVYSVSFDVVSAVDGHNTSGNFSFTSTGGDPCPGDEPVQEEPEPAPNAGGNDGASDDPDSAGGGDSELVASNDPGRGSASGAARQAGDPNRSRNRPLAQAGQGDKGPAWWKQAASVANVIGAPSEEEKNKESVWDGIPMGAFAAGLALSTLIGAAGGKIYAGIMGWTR